MYTPNISLQPQTHLSIEMVSERWILQSALISGLTDEGDLTHRLGHIRRKPSAKSRMKLGDDKTL